MPDAYYIKLAISLLTEAEKALVEALRYLAEAGHSDYEFSRVNRLKSGVANMILWLLAMLRDGLTE